MAEIPRILAKIDQAAIAKHVLEVRELYTAKATTGLLKALVMGRSGTGKTHLYSTCPRPIHIDCFDKGGTKTAELQPLIESGDIIVDASFQDDGWKSPKAFRNWERIHARRKQMGYYDVIGTYGIDSITAFADSMMYAILLKGDKGKGSRVGETPQIQDYNVQQYTLVDIMGDLMTLPCHVLVTGHIDLIRDEVSGELETSVLLAGKASAKVPNVFEEKYIARVVKGDYKLQMSNDGKYHASTRVGGKTFGTFEEPNIRNLLKRINFNWEDKPHLSTYGG